MKKFLSRLLIVIDSLARYNFCKKSKCQSNKNVLIVFQQVFGDSVLIQKSLPEYDKIYPKASGYDVKFLVRPSVHKFMEETMPLPEDIDFENVDFKLFLEDYVYYRKIIKKYTGRFSTIIVPGTSFSAEVFSSACFAEKKIGLVRSKTLKKPFVMALFNKIAYTERVIPENDEMIIQRHERLIKYLGGTDYQSSLSDLKPMDKIVDEDNYCVFCIGASSCAKCWPVDRFATVADYVISKYNMNIHICGGKEDVELVKQLIELSEYGNRIFSHTGNTTFSEWSSLVQNATLLISNDSATAHIGAAARVKTICITGIYDGKYVFPYKVSCLSENDILPESICVDMPCEGCRETGYFAGNNNSKCREQIKSGKCALCIDAVEADAVIRLVDKLMQI